MNKPCCAYPRALNCNPRETKQKTNVIFTLII